MVAFIVFLVLLGCSDSGAPKQANTHEAQTAPTTLYSFGHAPHAAQSSLTKSNRPQKIVLDVPIIKQNPELKYGCEVTSLAMVLQYAGVRVDKLTLARQIKKDLDPKVRNRRGDILSWGNPADGFVGDMTGKTSGYAVYDGPIADLMEQYLPERAINLTGQPFDELLKYVANKRPVVVWTTGDYRLPDRWESWKHGGQTIRTPLDLHAVVLVGFDERHVYINDPLSGKKAHKVPTHQFIDSWIALKKRAVSYN
jgi:uncharacterized protein YvpB